MVLTTAVHPIEQIGRVEATSGLYQTQAQYVSDQPDFLNAVVRLRTGLEPHALLLQLKAIEKEIGRVATFR